MLHVLIEIGLLWQKSERGRSNTRIHRESISWQHICDDDLFGWKKLISILSGRIHFKWSCLAKFRRMPQMFCFIIGVTKIVHICVFNQNRIGKIIFANFHYWCSKYPYDKNLEEKWNFKFYHFMFSFNVLEIWDEYLQ